MEFSSAPYSRAEKILEKQWLRTMEAFVAAGGERFVEHDIRAKVATDSRSVTAAQHRLGHATARLTESVYRRTGRRVRAATPKVAPPARRPAQPELF